MYVGTGQIWTARRCWFRDYNTGGRAAFPGQSRGERTPCRPPPSLFWGPRGLVSLAAANPEPARRSSEGPGSLRCGPGFRAGPQLPQGPALGGRGRRGAGLPGTRLGRSALRLTRSCWTRGPLTLESPCCRHRSPWVVSRASRCSPARRGPAGRGAGSGQHEPGGPAGRRGAGDGRCAAAGHPESSPERRRGPGEPVTAGRPGGLKAAAGRPDSRQGSASEPPACGVATLGGTAGKRKRVPVL